MPIPAVRDNAEGGDVSRSVPALGGGTESVSTQGDRTRTALSDVLLTKIGNLKTSIQTVCYDGEGNAKTKAQVRSSRQALMTFNRLAAEYAATADKYLADNQEVWDALDGEEGLFQYMRQTQQTIFGTECTERDISTLSEKLPEMSTATSATVKQGLEDIGEVLAQQGNTVTDQRYLTSIDQVEQEIAACWDTSVDDLSDLHGPDEQGPEPDTQTDEPETDEDEEEEGEGEEDKQPAPEEPAPAPTPEEKEPATEPAPSPESGLTGARRKTQVSVPVFMPDAEEAPSDLEGLDAGAISDELKRVLGIGWIGGTLGGLGNVLGTVRSSKGRVNSLEKRIRMITCADQGEEGIVQTIRQIKEDGRGDQLRQGLEQSFASLDNITAAIGKEIEKQDNKNSSLGRKAEKLQEKAAKRGKASDRTDIDASTVKIDAEKSMRTELVRALQELRDEVNSLAPAPEAPENN